MLPLAKPALATLAIFTLLGSWNDLIWPLIAISNEHSYTLQLGLANFQGTRRTQWSLLMAGNVVATLPLIIALPARPEAVRRDHDLLRAQGLRAARKSARADQTPGIHQFGHPTRKSVRDRCARLP